jgi:hypothetical protein
MKDLVRWIWPEERVQNSGAAASQEMSKALDHTNPTGRTGYLMFSRHFVPGYLH